jgi:uncharacterized protein
MTAQKKAKPVVVGVISDTHGALSEGALRALEGVDRIVHAGDIIGGDVISTLARIAKVVAVRGNMDRYSTASGLPRTALADIAGTSVYVLHDLMDLDIEPVAAGISVVVHGHTHRAEITWKNGVLYLNPGSARARADGTATIARLTLSEDGIVPEIIRLDPSLHRPAL